MYRYCFSNNNKYNTITDFNEAGMRIYIPKKVTFTKAARRAKSITVLVYDISTVNENILPSRFSGEPR